MEKHDMIKLCLAATAAFGIMTCAGFAQNATSTTTSTQSTAPIAPPVYGTATSQRTTTNDGVVTEKSKTYTTGTGVTQGGDLSATHTKTETTTVH
jgi:hypothetical protein